MVCLRRLYELNNVVYGQQRAVQGISFEGILEFAKIHSVQNTNISMLEFLEGRMPGISDQLRESWGHGQGPHYGLGRSCGRFGRFESSRSILLPEIQRSGHRLYPNCQSLLHRMARANTKIDGDFIDCRGAWLELCEYFQEDPEACKPNEFLRIWSELLAQLEIAKTNVCKRIKTFISINLFPMYNV